MADARPFHWEYTPEPVAREVFRIEGGRPLEGTVRVSGAKNAALKLLAAAVLTGERCRFTNVPEIEDVRVMVADAGGPGRRGRPPRARRLRGGVRRRGLAVRPARGRREDAGQLHPPRAPPVALRPRDHEQPGRRPDRAAARQPARRRDARPRRGDRVPQRLLLRQGAGPAPGRGRHVPVRLRHGDGERDPGRNPGRWADHDPARGARARGGRPDRVPPEDGRRGGADRPGHDRGRGPATAPGSRAHA